MTDTDALPREAILVVNAQSRRGRATFKDARRKLKDAGITLLSAHAVRNPKHFRDVIKKALETSPPMVIVGGGDGSLSSAVDDFVRTRTVFALLPLGTANSFARTLGIPLDLDGAIGVIANGARRRIDLGMIDDDYYANCATLGLAPLIAETVPHGLKKMLGRTGYLAWAGYRLSRFKPFSLTVDDGTTARTLDAVEVRIANGRFHGGAELVEDARVDSGEIVVQVVTGKARHRLLWSWSASLLRLRSRKQTYEEFHGQQFRLSTEKPMPVSIDGEVLAHTPCTARIARQVIEVAAPR
ncbi:YegS/Rv2252/BmrU family lipid kinase [Sphingomonas jejuensis]|uniref:YegS/Rv2252/BmrU family lipid kinase n=1 Tax=Sphingomonas jejuensis TaxID=904715 RepID=A0ABX0XJ34_9SPHN|nr:YegS/Rv2252/BmrU family lipid kinase [Sphingomonas jejuensis]NJC32751.1 YegS/Rv2252/BmrU family lipid kinase [Sphingomonas jejuensis]